MSLPYIIDKRPPTETNAVFLTLSAGGLFIPSSTYTQIEIKNQTIDSVMLESTDKNDDGNLIIPSDDNLPIVVDTSGDTPVFTIKDLDWQNKTELMAQFENGSLEAGSVASTTSDVSKIFIRRSSNRSNFTKWEDVHEFPISYEEFTNPEGFFREYHDKFIESGILYKYTYQPSSDIMRGPSPRASEILTDFTYSWLIGQEEKQMLLAFNPQISNFNYIQDEVTTKTIGSKYPYVFRNSNIGYREFEFSGTIAMQIDIENHFTNIHQLFLNEGEVVNPSLSLLNMPAYTAFNKNHNFTERDNYIAEREFRRQFEVFLRDGKPKIFKSDTEGLLLVRITNVSLSPKNELSRTIYDFSCTMTEIGAIDYETLIKFNLKTKGGA